jgi:MYXO-CTERM domain-containing protein
VNAKQLPRMGHRIQLWLGVLLTLISLPTPSTAYVRSRTRSCRTIFWPQSCLYIQPDGDLLGDAMAPADVLKAINSAIGSWNDRLNVSSFMQLRYLPPDGPKEVNPIDGLQLIKFHRDRFCRPATATDSMEMCLDPSATAVTTVTFINRPSDPLTDGLIIDADIDLNAVDFQFYDASGPPPSNLDKPPIDLWNTLTHEMGHMMGLDHTCSLYVGSVSSCAVDDQNRPVPDCSLVEMSRILDERMQTIYESTMYPSASPGETAKRLPHADDVAGIINAYPKVHDPLICQLPAVVQSAGCATSTRAVASPPLFAVAASLALGGLLGRRRRRRQAKA